MPALVTWLGNPRSIVEQTVGDLGPYKLKKGTTYEIAEDDLIEQARADYQYDVKAVEPAEDSKSSKKK